MGMECFDTVEGTRCGYRGEAEAYEPCTGNEECAEPGQRCEMACLPPCTDSDECPPGLSGTATPYCAGALMACVLSCEAGEMCPAGTTCGLAVVEAMPSPVLMSVCRHEQ